ncbi:MAG: ABC transporter ATP-binding protein [Thermodesulfobacteriota bacterium]|nr:ABC transporter ATP-binding protein [Thermodesulfobacteriota bacterium]
MASEVAVSLKGVGKRFKLFNNRRHRIMELFSLGRRKYHREFWAIKDIDLEVKRGEALGIIGANGSGKTTLLQIIAGILDVNEGEVKVNGKIGTLLDLGACFLPEYTGEQNIRFFAKLLGHSDKEIDVHFPEIVEFADIGDFIKQPVTTYSQGMFLRLAFATAISIKPDIILVDELLAVGDFGFRNKCYDAIRSIRKNSTMIVVTHDLNAVKTFAPMTIILKDGNIDYVGPTDLAVDKFITESLTEYQCSPSVYENGSIQQSESIGSFNIELTGEKGFPTTQLLWGERWSCNVELTFKRPVRNSCLTFHIRTIEGIEVCGKRVLQNELGIEEFGPGQPLHINFSSVAELMPANYFFVIILQDDMDRLPPSFLYVNGRALSFGVLPGSSTVYYGGLVNWPITCHFSRGG